MKSIYAYIDLDEMLFYMMKMNANKEIPVLNCNLLPLVPLSMLTNDDSMISTDKSEYMHKCGYMPGYQINCTPEPHS